MDWKKITPWNWLRGENTPNPNSLALGGLHRDIDRLFDETFRGMGFPVAGHGETMNGFFSPSLDIRETDKSYAVTMEMPGVNKDQVEVTVKDDRLTIRGEKKQETEKKDEHCHYSERSYGSFQRVLTLPDDADGSKIKADFKEGVLTLTLPKRKGTNGATRVTIQ